MVSLDDIALKTETKECTICLCDIEETISIETCNHNFCKECIEEFIKTQIDNGITTINCPYSNCKISISPKQIISLIDKSRKDKYESFSINGLFELNKDLLTWCLTPGCEYGFEYDKTELVFKCPKCLKSYCFKCKSLPHENSSCEENKDKIVDSKFHDLAKNNNYKQCEKCNYWIEKSQGCNHMKCKCGHEFCYVCGKPGVEVHVNCKSPEVTNNPIEQVTRPQENLNVGVISTPETHFTNYNISERNAGNFPNMSYRVNMDYSYSKPVTSNIINSSQNTYVYQSLPKKMDGSLDMRYTSNKEYVYQSLPKKMDGSLDMRYSANKEYARSRRK